MKKTRTILATLLIAVCGMTNAQPASVKNVAKSVFTLTTFRADGSLLASSHGVFVGQDGEAISDLKSFIGAASAVVIDHKGNKMNVARMMGINDIYNVAKFRVDGKPTPAPIAAAAGARGDKSWLVGYGLKNPAIEETSIKKVESFMNQYAYYIFGMNAPDNAISCPFVNASGEILGLMQISTTTFDTHATDARYINSLQLTALSYSDANLRQIGIPMSMPTNQEQAQLALVMAGQSGDSLKYVAAIDDFLKMFPTVIDGYDAKARQELNRNLFDQAANTMEEGIKKVAKKDEAHYNYSKVIYDKEIYRSQVPYDKWSLDKAMEEAQKAYEVSPLPVYKHLQAQITFSKGDYQQAYNDFLSLYQDKTFSNPELLYEAARCKQLLNAPAKEVIALLDSAINTTDSLQISNTAPYYFARAASYEQLDSFRQAAFDYTRYEYLMRGNVSANFYYLREQVEVKGKLYQQALADITRAILLDPKNATYYAEMASLQLRVNMIEQAEKTAEQCIKTAPDYSDGYLLLGLAQVKLGKKETGIYNLQKAKELGNWQAETFIEKYSK